MPNLIDEIVIPDSRIARDATTQARQQLTPAIFAHSMRTFLFGSLAGRGRQLAFDPELLYVAAMLHDLGFAASEHMRPFELDGADAARSLLRASDDSRAQAAWDAIAMHTVPHLATEREAEVLLLHLGSSADAFGARLNELPSGDVASVFAHYPRTTLASEFDNITTAIGKHHPYGQLAAFRALGLRYLV